MLVLFLGSKFGQILIWRVAESWRYFFEIAKTFASLGGGPSKFGAVFFGYPNLKSLKNAKIPEIHEKNYSSKNHNIIILSRIWKIASNTLLLSTNIWSINFFWVSILNHSIFLGVRNLTSKEHRYQRNTCAHLRPGVRPSFAATD